MSLNIRALIITVVVAGVIGFGFYRWRASAFKTDIDSRIDQLNKMETQGLVDFSGKDLSGQDFRLADLKGKVVILSFWASWCGPCVEEFPSMIKLVNEMKGKVALVAVTQDSVVEDVTAFLKAFPGVKNPDIHIIMDMDRKIGKLYNADRLPESYIANRNLNLERKIVGSIDWATPDALEYMNNILKK